MWLGSLAFVAAVAVVVFGVPILWLLISAIVAGVVAGLLTIIVVPAVVAACQRLLLLGSTDLLGFARDQGPGGQLPPCQQALARSKHRGSSCMCWAV